jgi:HEAT repeat protein
MKRSLCLFLLILLAGWIIFRPKPASPSVQSQHSKLPEFVDDPERGVNEDLAAPRQKLIYYRNFGAIQELLKIDPAIVGHEMELRLAPSQPMPLRLIAAAVLVFKKDDLGRQFFVAQSKINENLGDVFVTINHIAWSTETLLGPEADLSWAEDLMIEALQNRTRINRQDALHFPERISWGEPTIEIRELAVQYGGFSDHLLRMRSQKALPVILSLLREDSFYSLKTSIRYLGRYQDPRVASLLLEILSRHQNSKGGDTYRFAVGAAAEMGLKAAIPILLRHLEDEDSYPGLTALADASVIPRIKAVLPRLKSYARAQAELALVFLQGGDVVPGLLELLKRKDYLKRDDVIMKLEELHDPRSVPMIAAALCYDADWFVRSESVRVLAAVRNQEALQGLVSGLGCDFSKLRRGKTSRDHDYNDEYRSEIAKYLQEITGQKFGVDQKQWAGWFSRQGVP